MTRPNENRSPRHWWLPSVSVALWLAIFLALNFSGWRFALINVDGDPCLHWRIGDWMIQHHAIIRSDPFSHTRTGAPMIAMEWLSEVLYAAAGNALGWNGIVFVAAALIATSLSSLHRLVLAEDRGILLSTAVTLLAAWSCSLHWLARPHLWTFVFIVIFLWQLRAFDCGHASATRLFMVLPPLTILWANLHGGFVGGLVLIAAFWIGSAADALTRQGAGHAQGCSKMRVLTLLGGVCLLASLLNPNGWTLHAYILDNLRDPQLTSISSEFRSPDFHGFWMRGFLAQFLMLGLLLIIARPRLSCSDLALVAIWGSLSLHSVRHASILALVVTPVLAEHWSAWIRSAPDSTLMRFGRRLDGTLGRWNTVADGRIVAAGCVAVFLTLAAKPRWFGGPPIVTSEILRSRFPVSAVEFLRAHPNAVRGDMFNERRWGGYLVLAAPGWRVFVDSSLPPRRFARTVPPHPEWKPSVNGHHDGENLIEEFLTVDEVEPQWEKVLARYGVGWTILPRTHALNSLLALRTDWHLVYTDEVATVYGRTTGPL